MLQNAIQIGSLTLKNRLVMPPMATGKSDAGYVTEEMISYYRDRAQFSAPGLIILEHAFIAPAGRASAGQLSIADDACIAGLTKLVQAIHETGSAVIAQLNHAGSGAEPETPGVNLSASAIASPRKPESGVPREMTRAEILLTAQPVLLSPDEPANGRLRPADGGKPPALPSGNSRRRSKGGRTGRADRAAARRSGLSPLRIDGGRRRGGLQNA